MTGDAIYNILYNGGSGAVFDLVGNRIWPDQAPQNATYPFIVYRIADTEPSDTKDGVSQLDVVTVTIESYATARTVARSTAEAVRTLLDRKTAGTYGGINLDGVRFAGQQSANFQSDPHIFVFEQMFQLRYKR